MILGESALILLYHILPYHMCDLVHAGGCNKAPLMESCCSQFWSWKLKTKMQTEKGSDESHFLIIHTFSH